MYFPVYGMYIVLHTIPLPVQCRFMYYQIVVYVYQPHQPLPRTKTRQGNGSRSRSRSRSHAHVATASELHRDATHAPHGDDDAHDILLGEESRDSLLWLARNTQRHVRVSLDRRLRYGHHRGVAFPLPADQAWVDPCSRRGGSDTAARYSDGSGVYGDAGFDVLQWRSVSGGGGRTRSGVFDFWE